MIMKLGNMGYTKKGMGWRTLAHTGRPFESATRRNDCIIGHMISLEHSEACGNGVYIIYL